MLFLVPSHHSPSGILQRIISISNVLLSLSHLFFLPKTQLPVLYSTKAELIVQTSLFNFILETIPELFIFLRPSNSFILQIVISSKEVISALSELNTMKSYGRDGIPPSYPSCQGQTQFFLRGGILNYLILAPITISAFERTVLQIIFFPFPPNLGSLFFDISGKVFLGYQTYRKPSTGSGTKLRFRNSSLWVSVIPSVTFLLISFPVILEQQLKTAIIHLLKLLIVVFLCVLSNHNCFSTFITAFSMSFHQLSILTLTIPAFITPTTFKG